MIAITQAVEECCKRQNVKLEKNWEEHLKSIAGEDFSDGRYHPTYFDRRSVSSHSISVKEISRYTFSSKYKTKDKTYLLCVKSDKGYKEVDTIWKKECELYQVCIKSTLGTVFDEEETQGNSGRRRRKTETNA